MLSEKFFIECSDDIVEVYNQYTDSIIEKMAYEIKALGKLDNIERQARLAISAGAIYDDMIAKLAKLTQRSQSEIRKLLSKTATTSLEVDDQIYRNAGFDPAPIHQSPVMLQIMTAIASSTNQDLNNMVKTSARATSNMFMQTLNEAFMQTATGALDYNTAITSAIKKLATFGTVVDYPSGASSQLDVAVRRCVLSGVSNATNHLQLERANEFGALYADTSAHSGARPSHQEWQGMRFRLSDAEGVNMDYPHFINDDFGTENKPVFEQLDDANCRHSWYPVMYDEEPLAYTKEYIDEINNKRVYYGGKEYTAFEAEQRVRQMERNVRRFRRQANALEIAGLDNSFEINKVRYWSGEIKSFCSVTGIQRRYVNERVYY